MAEPSSKTAADVAANCRANAAAIAVALGRAFDGNWQISVGKTNSYQPELAADGLGGPGLVLVLPYVNGVAAAILPDSTSFVPDECRTLDAATTYKLKKLAKELSALFMPDPLCTASCNATYVDQIAGALAAAKIFPAAWRIPLELKVGAKVGRLDLIWSWHHPTAVAAVSPETRSTAVTDQNEKRAAGDFSKLPGYARSLLKVPVPVSVTLAAKKQRVNEITKLGPGSIIKFDKSCNELVELNAGNRPIADGEVVKVGDKFGLRIHQMLTPHEHFSPVAKQNTK